MALLRRLASLMLFGSAVLSAADAFAAEPAKKSEGDVVFDNRSGKNKEKQKGTDQQETAPAKETDTPFADTAPNPAALRAQRWQPGFGFGARLGFAFPFGSLGDASMKDYLDGLIFAWGDFGYWPIPYLFAGFALSGGYVLPKCGLFDSCSGWELRGGPEVIARFLPFEKVTPWVGLGFGYEWMWLKYSSQAFSEKVSAHGLELVNFQGGVDVLNSGHFLGIFASFSIGKFSSGKLTSDSSAGNDEKDLGTSSTHSWLAIGARGTFE